MKKIFFGLLFLSSCFFSSPLYADFVEFPAEENATQYQQKVSAFNNVASFFSFALALVFMASLFGIFLSGITFIVAGGDEGSLDKARRYILTSTVGLVISMIGYISLNLLKHFF